MNPSDVELVGRLVAAALIGATIGFEREAKDRPAGIRTHALVSLGAALFTIAGAYGFEDIARGPNIDPARVAAQVATGIGFVGAGAIFRSGLNVQGLTTAATLWLAAALGVVAGAGDLILAAAGGAILLVIVIGLRAVKSTARSRFGGRRQISVTYVRGHGLVEELFRHVEHRQIVVSRVQVRNPTSPEEPDRATVTLDISSCPDDVAGEISRTLAQRDDVRDIFFGARAGDEGR